MTDTHDRGKGEREGLTDAPIPIGRRCSFGTGGGAETIVAASATATLQEAP